MDPISITCIVIAGSIVITSMGRFISKKYHSYKSQSNEHDLEMTTEATSADGAHTKTTLKIHGNSHDLNMMGAEHQEHGDPEAVKALSSLSMILSGALGSNHTTTSIDSMASTATDDSKSKHAIALDVKKGLSSAVNDLKSEFSNQKQSVDKSKDKKLDVKKSPDSVMDRDLDMPVDLVNHSSCKHGKIVPLLDYLSHDKEKGGALYLLSFASRHSSVMALTGDEDEKAGWNDLSVCMDVSKQNIAEHKLEATIGSDSGSEEFFDARDNDVRSFHDDDLSIISMSGACSSSSFSNEF